ncbi:MAG: hypothetical protein K2P78_00945 [Gemmataceae bacterium]|nr:hypothetical protein [Gemmataceae bacterium]
MSIPVIVTPESGAFTAAVLGESEVRATGPTRDAAVAALRAELQQRVASGELAFIDVGSPGVLGLAGAFRDDPLWAATWDDIRTEIYRERAEQKAREFPE